MLDMFCFDEIWSKRAKSKAKKIHRYFMIKL